MVTSGSDADGAYMKIDANKASNAGVAIAATSQIVNWTDCFGGKITYKAGMSYVFKARIKLPETKTGCVFCAVYEDGYDIISRPPSAPYSDVYEAVYTTKSGKSLLKIVLYVDYWRPIYIYDIQLTEGNKAPHGIHHGRRGCAGADRAGEAGCGLHCLGFEPDAIRQTAGG